MQKFEYINNMGIAVNSAFTSSANVLTAANKAGGMLYFIKKDHFHVSHLEYAIQPKSNNSKKDIYHLERIQRAATRWVKGLRGLTYEEGQIPKITVP